MKNSRASPITRRIERHSTKNLKAIWRARNALLRDGEVAPILSSIFPGSGPIIESRITDSFIYGYSEEDIAIICLTGELGGADDHPFPVDKLTSCYNFVRYNPEKIGLVVEDRDVAQRGMFRSNQSQVVVVITRTS